jgi:hypothetical protein
MSEGACEAALLQSNLGGLPPLILVFRDQLALILLL